MCKALVRKIATRSCLHRLWNTAGAGSNNSVANRTWLQIGIIAAVLQAVCVLQLAHQISMQVPGHLMRMKVSTTTAPDMNIKLPDDSLKYSFIVSRPALENSRMPTMVRIMSRILSSRVLLTTHVNGEPPAVCKDGCS